VTLQEDVRCSRDALSRKHGFAFFWFIGAFYANEAPSFSVATLELTPTLAGD
jgi:hypothetical protein